jgi:glycosyltransferase involved in cell wall biosynthesis
MYILIISRGVPTPQEPQWGCFEKDQAEALAALGHKVVVASIDCRFKWHLRRIGITHHRINNIDYYDSFYIPDIFINIFGLSFNFRVNVKQFNHLFKTILKKHGKPDIIYGHFFTNTALGYEMSRKYHIPLVGIEHAGRFNEDRLDPKTLKEATIAYQNSSAVIAVSNNLRYALEKHFNVQPYVIYNTFGREFEYKAHDFDKTFHLVSTGSLLYGKGFDLLITALNQINLNMHNWDLQIIGEGNDRLRLENLIVNYGLQEKIHLIGKRSKTEIAAILQASDCFILPSRGENFSVAVLEALACGCPVISSNCGDIKACINDMNGLLFEVEDVNGLANCLQYMFEHYQDYDRKAIASDCKVRFSPEVIAKQLTAIFNKAIQNE